MKKMTVCVTRVRSPVRLQQRPDQQHGGAGGADEGREQRADGQEGGVDGGVASRSPLSRTPPEIT